MTFPYESTTDPTALYVPPQGYGEWLAAVGSDIDIAKVLGTGKCARVVTVKEGGLLNVQFTKGGPRLIPVASGGSVWGVTKIFAASSTAYGLAIYE